MDPVAGLLAKQEIAEVIHRYCRGIDRLDRELVLSCYHPGAIDAHGSFVGPVEEFVVWCWPILSKHTSTMHFIGNLLVELDPHDDDVAHVETYAIAHHRGDPADPKRNLITGCRYVDRFVRADGVWRIAHRDAVTDWVRVDDPQHQWPISEALAVGRRDRTDPVYRR